MKALSLLALIIAGVAQGEVLRISEVREVAGDDTERMTHRYRLEGQDKEEELFVLKEVIVGDKDVARAAVAGKGEIYVELNPEGAKAMEEATGNMIPGRSRMAIIVDGKVVSAPGIRMKLGGKFQISGMEEMGDRALENLARRMSGKPELDPKEEVPQPTPPRPRPKTAPYTEEEYQQIKARRENMGIFQLDRVPSKEELDAKLKIGMDRDAVVAALGKPYMTTGNEQDGTFQLTYEIAPEKRAENPERKMIDDGIRVCFSEGKVTRWDFTSSNIPRDEKVVGRVPGVLVASYPKVDFSAGDVDVVAMVEGIKIPDIRQELNVSDQLELISIASMTSNFGEGTEKDLWISTQCDFMKILALHFPEARDLVDGSAHGKVTVKALGAAISPYANEGKSLPELKASPAEQKQ